MEQTSNNSDFVPGAVGPFIDDLPLATNAFVKPYIIAILLHRGAVRPEEVAAAMIPHCPLVDMKTGIWDDVENYNISDKTRLEILIDEVLGEMVAQGILRYNDKSDLWVLQVGKNKRHLPEIINWVSATSGQLPYHLLLDLSFNT